MGRKRIDENEKKVRFSISIKKKNLDVLKSKEINISNLIETLIENWLKNKS